MGSGASFPMQLGERIHTVVTDNDLSLEAEADLIRHKIQVYRAED